jgi:hypothetical protein
MIQLAYVSTATRLMSNEDLTGLLAQSRQFNAANHVTGMLLYKDRSFLQVLEGDEDVLIPLYDRIRRDRRHEKVKTLFMTDVPARDFADWCMGFKNLDGSDLNALAGYCDFMEEGETARSMFEDLTRAKKLLLLFRTRS